MGLQVLSMMDSRSSCEGDHDHRFFWLPDLRSTPRLHVLPSPITTKKDPLTPLERRAKNGS